MFWILFVEESKMGIRAYNEVYLEDAMNTMGTMLDYAVNYCNWDIDAFFQKFLYSELFPRRFERGHPGTVSGKSGVELYRCVLGEFIKPLPEYVEINRSPEYWVGWALAFSQWYMNRSFKGITDIVKPSELLRWYPVYHEMDVMHVVETIEERINEKPTNLERIRKKLGYSQKELAQLSTVSVRSIQMYEQRKNDISKAQFNVLNALAKVLNCSVYDLVDEDISH